MAYEQNKQIIEIDDDELRDLSKLSWSSFINFQLARVLKSETKEAFSLNVDKLESLMKSDLPQEYFDVLNAGDKMSAWRKFDLLIGYTRKRSPKEVSGEL